MEIKFILVACHGRVWRVLIAALVGGRSVPTRAADGEGRRGCGRKEQVGGNQGLKGRGRKGGERVAVT